MSNILPIPSTVYNWKNILVVDGVTYTLQKTTLQDKDFVISCWDEPSPNNYNFAPNISSMDGKLQLEIAHVRTHNEDLSTLDKLTR